MVKKAIALAENDREMFMKQTIFSHCVSYVVKSKQIKEAEAMRSDEKLMYIVNEG